MYAVGAVLLLGAVRAADGGEGPRGPARRGRAAVAAGAGVHVLVGLLGGLLGAQPGFAGSLSGVALAIAVVVVALPARLGVVAAVLAPLATGLQGASLLAPERHVVALDALDATWWLPLHMTLVLGAVALFLLELSVGAVQVVVRGRLKRKQLGALQRMPSLDVLDRLQVRALVAGVACLGLGLVVGSAGAATQLEHAGLVTDPKVAISAGIWLWYVIVLQARVRRGWHGWWGVRMSAVGVLALLFSWVALEFVAGGFHAYG
ncbi:MAG: cytochrome c biogenesis protein CcsA [Alphaproteobacteria bacterium]|nr:cytochrome c biogenesis protein CcsA [Alphaproteobacteria bacterium]